ncbi:protein DOG1-like 3 [Capsicum annuum]|uniref:protein DOG1-like 3 n=1 Tax=Capsicum annuum TaxID=4072 RepID=UPI0007BF752B|nr:protein DOG1-like 3 [Capsicum annuum]
MHVNKSKELLRKNKMESSCSSSPSTSNDRREEACVFETWMALQREEAIELQQTVDQSKKGQINEHQLNQLIQKILQHFQDYTNIRSRRARIDVSPFFAPTTCTPLENSVLWIAGCRPASFIRFAYALSGVDIESNLTDFLQGKRIGDLGELTMKQMSMIDVLQAKTIKEEKRLCSRLASLQEDILDQPLVGKVKKYSSNDEPLCEDADEALDEHGQHMADLMEEADELRMKTLKEIVLDILKPVQAVEYLAAAKRTRLCFHKWGEKREHQHTNK